MKKYFYFLIFLVTASTITLSILSFYKAADKIKTDKPRVVTSIFPVYDLVRNVGGEQIEVVLLLPAGVSPHTFEPKPLDIQKIEKADVLFYIGHGLDDWAAEMAKNAGVKKIVVVDKNIELLESTLDEDNQHQEGTDPHYWLSPENAVIITETVSQILSEIDPTQATIFAENSRLFEAQIIAQKERLAEQVKGFSNKNIATFHNAWQYFARSFGLNIATVFEEFPGKEPTPQYLKEFQEKIREHDIKAVFSEPQFSPSTLKPIADDLQVTLSFLDPIGGIDDRNSYLNLLQFNIEQIIKSLK